MADGSSSTPWTCKTGSPIPRPAACSPSRPPIPAASSSLASQPVFSASAICPGNSYDFFLFALCYLLSSIYSERGCGEAQPQHSPLTSHLGTWINSSPSTSPAGSLAFSSSSALPTDCSSFAAISLANRPRHPIPSSASPSATCASAVRQ